MIGKKGGGQIRFDAKEPWESFRAKKLFTTNQPFYMYHRPDVLGVLVSDMTEEVSWLVLLYRKVRDFCEVTGVTIEPTKKARRQYGVQAKRVSSYVSLKSDATVAKIGRRGYGVYP